MQGIMGIVYPIWAPLDETIQLPAPRIIPRNISRWIFVNYHQERARSVLRVPEWLPIEKFITILYIFRSDTQISPKMIKMQGIVYPIWALGDETIQLVFRRVEINRCALWLVFRRAGRA